MDLELLGITQERHFGESKWHKEWKLAFPVEQREQTFLNHMEGFHHRADVFTTCGTAIEFQHSPISVAELRQREAFYPKMIWVLDGKMFKGFRLLKPLPDMRNPFLDAYEFAQGSNLALYRVEDLINGAERPRKLVLSHPELFHLKPSPNYYSFAWKNPHRVWYEAQQPLWIDLGGYFIYQLLQRRQRSGDYGYLKLVAKKEFIANFSI